MKKLSLFTLPILVLVAFGALAQGDPQLNNGHIHYYPTKDQARTGGGGGSNLVNHGGPVLTNPQVVFIFWGFGSGTSYTIGIQSFRDSGMYAYSRMLTQYSSAASATTSYSPNSGADVFDASTPPTNVTDADVQAEVVKYFHGAEGAQTVYEVVIPSTSYSSSGTSTSCGGPSLAYCAYHGNFADGTNDVKYAILPYPSCSGCQSAGFTDNENQTTSSSTRRARPRAIPTSTPGTTGVETKRTTSAHGVRRRSSHRTDSHINTSGRMRPAVASSSSATAAASSCSSSR